MGRILKYDEKLASINRCMACIWNDYKYTGAPLCTRGKCIHEKATKKQDKPL